MDTADLLAKFAASETTPSVQEFTYHEAILAVDVWIWEEWRREWDNNTTCKYQSIFQLNHKFLQPLVSRRKDIIMSRFRLLQSKLNSGLFKIGLHPDGKCSTCGQTEDTVHFLMDCTNTILLRKQINEKLLVPQSKWNYLDLTSDRNVMEIIATHVLQNNIAI